MIDLGDVRRYLPQYLSPGTTDKLLADLGSFPNNIDKRMYGFEGRLPDVIYQGDGINDLPIIHLPGIEIKESKALVVSNTCDIDLANVRKFDSNIVYAPILNLDKYQTGLRTSAVYSATEITTHINDIRQQRITQIFYLPQFGDFPESFVLLDNLVSLTSKHYARARLGEHRMFSLSQYGHYLFLYKLSIHFTRFHEKVDRIY